MSSLTIPSFQINGKFLSAAATGVHRVAAELITALDGQLAKRNGTWSLLTPFNATRPLKISKIQRRVTGLTTWQVWEQIDLPLSSGRGLLLNFCNLGPVVHPASIVMMHDAQVFSSPSSYSPQFGLFYRTIQPLLGRRALRILTVSEFSKGELIRFGVAPAEKIHVVPNGCDHLLKAAPDPGIIETLALDGRPFVLALANTQTHKNLRVLLQAFAQRSLSDVRLVLVGKADRTAFEAHGLTVPDTVVFAGGVPDGGFRALYEAAVCLAFPSTTEGFGLPPLEAMSLGCPVLAAPCGALPEVCGDAALYAPPTDPSAWAGLIRGLVDDRQHKERMAEVGRQHASGYTWASSAQKLLAVVGGL